ncbi:MAG: sodium:calcium antiporter [Chloroflexi bacterium]|nr:sodium:calcium antiporter [Chloroflexota bacterium]
MATVALLLAAMAVILAGCKLFTNGIEWLGRHLKLGDGSVGSILAAMGTALPETIVPIIAIALGATEETRSIGVGAIVGSSFMLATLALFVTGLAVAAFSRRGRRSFGVKADPAVLTRDLRFFIVAYGTTVVAALSNRRELQLALAVALLGGYVVYVFLALTGDDDAHGSLRRLYFQPQFDTPSIAATAAQMLVALALIVVGARVFVDGIADAARALAVPALVFSLLVTPLATELPEKVNCVLWLRQGKDTLALGNITGAMVYQACVLPAIGILLTPWILTTPALVAASLGLISAGAAYIQIRVRGNLHYRHLIGMGLLYLGFAGYAIGLAA